MNSHISQNRKSSDDLTGPSPIRISPYDFGEGRDKVLRALELNRQLLHESSLVLDFSEAIEETAVRAKIDELLDRLLRIL